MPSRPKLRPPSTGIQAAGRQRSGIPAQKSTREHPSTVRGGRHSQSSAAPDEHPIFICDASAEAERLVTSLRNRGYPTIDVPLGMLPSRVRFEHPALVVCDADAHEAPLRVREMRDATQQEIPLLFVGHHDGALTHDPSIKELATDTLTRPLDLSATVDLIQSIVGRPPERAERKVHDLRRQRSPVLVASARRPYRSDREEDVRARSSQPPPSVGSRSNALARSSSPLDSQPVLPDVHRTHPPSSVPPSSANSKLSAETRRLLDEGRRRVAHHPVQPQRATRVGSRAEQGSPAEELLAALAQPLGPPESPGGEAQRHAGEEKPEERAVGSALASPPSAQVPDSESTPTPPPSTSEKPTPASEDKSLSSPAHESDVEEREASSPVPSSAPHQRSPWDDSLPAPASPAARPTSLPPGVVLPEAGDSVSAPDTGTGFEEAATLASTRSRRPAAWDEIHADAETRAETPVDPPASELGTSSGELTSQLESPPAIRTSSERVGGPIPPRGAPPNASSGTATIAPPYLARQDDPARPPSDFPEEDQTNPGGRPPTQHPSTEGRGEQFGGFAHARLARDPPPLDDLSDLLSGEDQSPFSALASDNPALDAFPHTRAQPEGSDASKRAIDSIGRAIRERRTGSLAQEDGGGIRRVVFRDGDVLTATSSRDDETLTRYLRERGDISEETARTLSLLPPFGRHAGAALIARGVLAQDQLWPVLRAHAEWLLGRMLASPKDVVWEATAPARVSKEPAVFGGAAGAEIFMDLVTRVLSARTAHRLLGAGTRRLGRGEYGALLGESALDPGVERRALSAAGADLNLVLEREPDLLPVLLGLKQLGVLSSGGQPSAEPEANTGDVQNLSQEMDEEAFSNRVHARLALVNCGDYFAILGLPHSATRSEVEHARNALHRELSPQHLTPRTAHLKKDIEVLLQLIDEAHLVLGNDVMRSRYRAALADSPPTAVP